MDTNIDINRITTSVTQNGNQNQNTNKANDFIDIKVFNLNHLYKVKIVKRTSDNNKYIDIRKYWFDKPTKKGVTLSLEDFEKLINFKYD